MIKESDDEYHPNLDEMGENISKLEDVITVIKLYEEIIKMQKQQIISLLAQQGHILKKKYLGGVVWDHGLSKLTIYCKINLHKVFSKYPILKKLALSSHYFKNNINFI